MLSLRKLIIAAACTLAVSATADELGYPEKEELTFGFIKLTDMAPIAVAYENGYFEDEGLYLLLDHLGRAWGDCKRERERV